MKVTDNQILWCGIAAMLMLTASSPFAAEDVTERAVPGPTGAQQPGMRVPATVIPTMTVEQQIAALQQQVQSLQQQLSVIQSVVRISPTGTVIQAPALSLLSASGTVIQSDKGITVAAGQGLSMQSQGATMLKAGSSIAVEAQQTLDLKGGNQTRLNGGTKSIATVGSAVGNGQVLTGSPTIFGN
ncbi:MAG: hypothetical protein GDA67_04640 [Nitrospira sp. CR1.3]|nr:hypothetical protein [Nitrospira sp. CR1.3]